MLRVGSLFAGYGGIELAFRNTELGEPAWFVEWEPYAQHVLRTNYPTVPVYGDISKVDFTQLERVDVLTGGFPCQDISVAGKGAGIKVGTRSGLWYEFARAIRELRPKFVIIENVAAILNRGLDIVLGDLATLGYDAVWSSVPASRVGAPHRRDRVFIVAYPCSSDLGNSERSDAVGNDS